MCGNTQVGLDRCIEYFTPYWEQCPPSLSTEAEDCIVSAFVDGYIAARNQLPCSLYPTDKVYMCQRCDRTVETDLAACLLCTTDACADNFYGKSICRRLGNTTFINDCLACDDPGSVDCLVNIFSASQVINACYFGSNTTDGISACLEASPFCSPALFKYGPVECVGISGQIFLECGLPPAPTCVRELITYERQFYLMDDLQTTNPSDVCNLASLSSNQLCSGCTNDACYSTNLVADMCYGITDPLCLTCVGPDVLQSVYCAARYRAAAIVSCFYQQTLTCLVGLCNPIDEDCYDRIAAFSWRCPPSWNGLYFASDPALEIIDCISSILSGGYSP